MAVYLVDSQGLDALDQEGCVDQTLFAFTNFLSSHIIYSVYANVSANQLLQLAVLANHSATVDKANLPSLDIIVRDSNYPSDKIDRMIRHYNNEFKRLKNYFNADSVHIYPFPHPGEKVTKEGYKGDVKDIDQCFIKIIHHYFITSLDPKKLIPKFKNKEELLSIFGSMCENVLRLQKSGTDIFYEMITESHNNKLIFEYNEKYLVPLQNKCYSIGSNIFDIEYRKCIDELRETKDKNKN